MGAYSVGHERHKGKRQQHEVIYDEGAMKTLNKTRRRETYVEQHNLQPPRT